MFQSQDPAAQSMSTPDQDSVAEGDDTTNPNPVLSDVVHAPTAADKEIKAQ